MESKSGIIKAFGYEKEVTSGIKDHQFETIYDADGGCVIPGLIDGHTHPVWAGDRVHEFAMKVSFNIFHFILSITCNPVKSTRKRIIYRPKMLLKQKKNNLGFNFGRTEM